MGGILLTSTGFFTDEIRTAFSRMTGSFSSACIITTASPQKENNRFAQKAKDDLHALGATHIRFLDIEMEDPSCLQKFDVIYLNGGNPFHLLFQLKKSGAGKLLQQTTSDQTLVGVSAGSMVLGPSIEIVEEFTPTLNTIPLHDFTGLNMTEFTVFPHYDREDLFVHPSGDSIEKRIFRYERRSGKRIYRLKDDSYLALKK